MRAQCKGAKHARQGGAVIVELAIVLPIMLFLMLATAEFGRAFFQYNTLTKAVRDGGRYAAANALAGSLGTLDVNAIAAETQQLVVYGNAIGNGDVNVKVDASQRSSTHCCTRLLVG